MISALEHLSILLVEDNIYMRDILENCLRHLGFSRIALARNGEDAIEFLKLLQQAPARAGVLSVDLVISDLVMAPIDGLLLLKWVRQDKASPNRLMPFVMISGAADVEYVEEARDAGVTEFIAKPFSVASVYERLKRVIDQPRQVICCQQYFGPDRRRHVGYPPEGTPERRRRGEDHITRVYSADHIRRPSRPSDVWIFCLPNSLKDKMGGGTAPFVLPAEVLNQAEQELQRQSLDFRQWAVDYLKELSDLLEGLKLKPVHRSSDFAAINLVAHELRGQGATFGYPLMTVLARSLYHATLPGVREDDDQVAIIKAHVDAMRAVIREGITGDGGALGQELLQTLEHAIARHSPAGHPPPSS